MKKKIIIPLAALTMSILSCSHKNRDVVEQLNDGKRNIDKKYEREEDNERLAYWFPYHDSINHGMVDIAEVLWNIDSVSLQGANNARAIWTEKCKNTLIHAFDSIHAGAGLPDAIKADSMLLEIETFFEKDADLSTIGMMVNFSLQFRFLIFRTSVFTQQIIDYDGTSKKEIQAWDNLQHAMNDFCIREVQLDWFGGSGSGPMSLAMRNSIEECRLNDMKKTNDLCQGHFAPRVYDIKEVERGIKDNYQQSVTTFKQSVEKCWKTTTPFEEAKEYLMEGQWEEYESLYNNVHSAKRQLIEAFNKWLKIRKIKPCGAINSHRAFQNRYIEITKEMIESMSACVNNCHED